MKAPDRFPTSTSPFFTRNVIILSFIVVAISLGMVTAFMQETLGISGMLLVKAFAKERAERRCVSTTSVRTE